jgi:hypothetical protein
MTSDNTALGEVAGLGPRLHRKASRLPFATVHAIAPAASHGWLRVSRRVPPRTNMVVSASRVNNLPKLLARLNFYTDVEKFAPRSE